MLLGYGVPAFTFDLGGDFGKIQKMGETLTINLRKVPTGENEGEFDRLRDVPGCHRRLS